MVSRFIYCNLNFLFCCFSTQINPLSQLFLRVLVHMRISLLRLISQQVLDLWPNRLPWRSKNGSGSPDWAILIRMFASSWWIGSGVGRKTTSKRRSLCYQDSEHPGWWRYSIYIGTWIGRTAKMWRLMKDQWNVEGECPIKICKNKNKIIWLVCVKIIS